MLTPTDGTESPEATTMEQGAKSLKNPKVIAIAGAVVLVLLVILIRLIACSGGAQNLVDIVNKPSTEVASILRNQKETTILGYSYYTNDPDLVTTIYGASPESGNINDELRKHNGSYLFTPLNSSGPLTLDKISNGANPTRVEFDEVIVTSALSPKQLASHLTEIAPYEEIVTYCFSNGGAVSGMAKGNGCVSDFFSSEEDGVWMLYVTTYSIVEDPAGTNYEEDFDYLYDNFEPSDYFDSYKK